MKINYLLLVNRGLTKGEAGVNELQASLCTHGDQQAATLKMLVSDHHFGGAMQVLSSRAVSAIVTANQILPDAYLKEGIEINPLDSLFPWEDPPMRDLRQELGRDATLRNYRKTDGLAMTKYKRALAKELELVINKDRPVVKLVIVGHHIGLQIALEIVAGRMGIANEDKVKRCVLDSIMKPGDAISVSLTGPARKYLSIHQIHNPMSEIVHA